MLKPLAVLGKAANNNVIVVLRGKKEFRGVLDGYDQYMNVVLKNAEELQEGQSVARYRMALVRGDNIIYISP
ncbi:MAG: LSM domain-containing protein [Candidatus Methanomethylophilaceae archaeon]|jgi:small nuclear ribonucleoprotein